ncbi:MAG: right-handed parallel beta-helix repeat-containing protein, partial [Opitutales bacterium]|nr:right-handed parallel beta-helix repeat-containing protein [Opitutales bacterium]
ADYPFLEAHPLHGFGKARYSLENVREALKHPGQWHLSSSTGVLTYLPREEESLGDTRIEAPRLVQILRVRGDVNRTRFVQNLRISGLTFKKTAVDFLAHYGTHNNAANSGPGVISFEGVRYSTVEECRFENIGEYGVDLQPGSSNNTIVGNHFTEMGCGAIKSIGAWLGSDAPKARYNWLNTFTDNTVIGGGRIYHGSPGIISNKAGITLVAHNKVTDFLYNGIVVGGGPLPQFANVESRIENNLVYNIGQGELSDMGAIYVHGSASGVVIRGNVAYDVTAKVYGGSTLYLDDSASHITVENNIFYGGNSYAISMKGREHIIRNNILAFGGKAIIRRGDLEEGRMNTAVVMKNILLTRDGIPVFSSRPETHIIDAPAIVSDSNLIWDATGQPLQVSIPQHKRQPDIMFSFDEWRDGPRNDLWSIVADPLFADPENGDFRLHADSPADDVGYRVIDFSGVGPRARSERLAAQGMPADIRTIETHVE